MVFINSDPGLIKFFLRFLDEAGVSSAQTAVSRDTSTRLPTCAERNGSGRGVIGRRASTVSPDQSSRVTIRRTVRKNVGADYHGCLSSRVRRAPISTGSIDGWTSAIMADAQGPDAVRAR